LKIIVTGASGFIGSWICRVLSISHDVTALVQLDSNTFRLKGINSIKVVSINSDAWKDFILRNKPEVLVLADWWGVENTFRDDEEQFENVHRILKLGEAAKEVKVNTVIGIGSQAEIGSVEYTIDEDSPDNPSTKYGIAKVQTRQKMNTLFTNSETRFVWMRIFSSYGPLDTGNWLIPKLVDTLTAGERMSLTSGDQEWNYLHVYDLAKAFKMVIETKNINGIVNVGNIKTIKIKSAILEIAYQLESKHLLDFGALDYRDDQVMKLIPNCEKLVKSGWEPVIEFESGITQTILWLQRKNSETLSSKYGEKISLNLPARP
jgi:nucleoside-diphosphate-sugar epimerase